ncbi:MAG: hypothetical protein BHW64_05285 [Candidatus Melainabacteria bacterium LEY3_CP_29_8]|nr:MAG: hypothetical protein BHW64_05285 [Candidatus Melainabacteria bacterium LEY3_CP_29_8]
MRQVEKERKTNETDIKVKLNLDGNGAAKIKTPIRFFNHMLEQVVLRSGIDLEIEANSLDGNQHHLVEDVGITLGKSILEALGEKRGINRYGSVILPMDEALSLVAIDFSGRALSKINVDIKQNKTDDFETILLPHFFQSFASSSLSTIHIKTIEGQDPHHIIESIFKAFGEAIKIAIKINNENINKISSTKGVL